MSEQATETRGMKPGEGFWRKGCDLKNVPIAMASVFDYVEQEVRRQDEIHPDGFPATRDGLRLGIGALEDEVEEVKRAWRQDRRRKEACPWTERGEGHSTETELLQVVAVGLRMLRSIHEAAGPARGEW